MADNSDPNEVPAGSAAHKDGDLAELRDLVPEAFRDGVLDPDALLSHLGVHVGEPPEVSDRPYSFTWSGIELAREEATLPTSASLRPDPSSSVSWDDTQHVAIEGDNLQVLKLLLNAYRGRFKFIYIDPPYNTGSTFTYSDQYAVPEAEWLRASGQTDEDGLALRARLNTSGRKHAPWLTMMLPRLVIARHLLARDGAIIAAIDDNEVHHLRQLMDAVFSEANFVGSFVWEGGRKNDARFVSVGHDYMLCYARDKARLVNTDTRWRVRKKGLAEIYEREEALRAKHGEDYAAMEADLKNWYEKLPADHPSRGNRHYRLLDKRGIYYPDNLRSPNPRPNLKYDWKGFKPHANGWAVNKERMAELDADDRLVYPSSPEGRISIKRYLHENEDQVLSSVFYRDRRASANALTELMGAEVFDFPKDTTILAQLLEAITKDDDLVLDFFAGSGSTGQAVWEQNKADGGKRRFVLVQEPAATETDSEAKKAGYDTIFALMNERLVKASANLSEAGEDDSEDLGFRVFRTAESTLHAAPPVVSDGELDGSTYVQQSLEMHAAPAIKAGAATSDVTWEILLKGTRYDLTARVTEVEGDIASTFEVSDPEEEDAERTFVCLADDLDASVVEALELSENDTLICLKEAMDDGAAITVGQRCHLVVIERVRNEVSL